VLAAKVKDFIKGDHLQIDPDMPKIICYYLGAAIIVGTKYRCNIRSRIFVIDDRLDSKLSDVSG
jgi:hypothetical protein